MMEVLTFSDVAFVVVAISYVIVDEELGLVTPDLPCILKCLFKQLNSLRIILYLDCNCTHLDQRFYLDLVQL